MASALMKSSRLMKRMDSKKSHSWWWDSHISPKNSKWLQDNLEEMDQHIKRMLKLIEEDADSFAKKAEMYYQKRPELIHLVEEFYRMYRSLAERYDNVTGELRKNMPSDLQSQSSGISEVGSEPPSTMPSPDRRPSRRRSGPRAAGFDFFLGGGGNKEGDESSTLDSESDSDDSSVNNDAGSQKNDEDQALRLKIIELEVELREVRAKLRVQEDEISVGSFKKSDDESSEVFSRIAAYDEELHVARQKIQQSEEEVTRLMIELQKYKSLGDSGNLLFEDAVTENRVGEHQQSSIGPEAEVLESLHKIHTLEEELRIGQEKLLESEQKVANLRHELTDKDSSIQNLQEQLKSAHEDISMWKSKLEKEKREVSKLKEHIERYKENLTDHEQEIMGLKEAISNANKSLSEENEKLKEEMTRLLKEQTYLEDNLKELDLRCHSLEEDLRQANVGKSEAEATFGAQREQLKSEIAKKNELLEELKKSLQALQQKYDVMINEKDNLCTKIDELSAETSSKDDQLDQMSKHLNQLHMEHVELISGAEGARKTARELLSRVKELEREVERKQEIIREGAEEKREAIRQLCFSLEHYRNGYYRLREAVIGHKPVMAS